MQHHPQGRRGAKEPLPPRAGAAPRAAAAAAPPRAAAAASVAAAGRLLLAGLHLSINTIINLLLTMSMCE